MQNLANSTTGMKLSKIKNMVSSTERRESSQQKYRKIMNFSLNNELTQMGQQLDNLKYLDDNKIRFKLSKSKNNLKKSIDHNIKLFDQLPENNKVKFCFDNDDN